MVCAARPLWLQHALPNLRMSARIVDYWPHESNIAAQQLCVFMKWLGFNVRINPRNEAQQVSNACWAVAARSCVELRIAHEDEPGSWLRDDLSDAAHPERARVGNAVIDAHRRDPQADAGAIMKEALEI